ncbi:MAG: amidohydrolase family protein [Candidatus Anstonellales archaeon]
MLVYIREKKDWVKRKSNNAKDDRILLFPGFYNAHTHVAMTLLRGIAENLNLHDWLKNIVWPIEEQLNERDIYYSSLIGFYEMIESGVVLFNDMYWKHVEQIAKAAEDVGINGYVCYDVALSNDLKKAKTFLNKKYKHVKPCIALHSIYKADKELIKEAYEIAKEHSTLLHIHLAETREELVYSLQKFKKRPAEFLLDLGVIDSNTVLAHASWVTLREIKLLAEKKALIVHCPTSNLKLATGGICPLHEFQKYNANIAIGTDSVASNNALDMFNELKLAALLQKHRYWDASLPDLKELFYSATCNANANVIFELSINNVPFYDPYNNLIYNGNKKNIKQVSINNQNIINNGAFTKKHDKKIKECISYLDKRADDIREIVRAL